MRIWKHGLIVLGVILLSGCGDKEDQVVRRVSYDLTEENFSLNLEFNEDVELNTELTVPIKEYGFISLYPPEKDLGFVLGFGLNLNVINDNEIISLEKTRKLPNGQSMSRYVTTDVAQLKVDTSSRVDAYFYVGLEPENFYLGTALNLFFLDDDFSLGLVVSQRLRDNQGRPIGVISLYGPEIKDGELLNPGGLFFMTNVSDLIRYSKEDEEGFMKDILKLVRQQIFFPGAEIETMKNGEQITLSRREMKKLIKTFKKKAGSFLF